MFLKAYRTNRFFGVHVQPAQRGTSRICQGCIRSCFAFCKLLHKKIIKGEVNLEKAEERVRFGLVMLTQARANFQSKEFCNAVETLSQAQKKRISE